VVAFPLPAVAASLMPLRAVAGCPSSGLARLAEWLLDGRSAMGQALFSEWRTEALGKNPPAFCCASEPLNGVTALPS